MVNLEMVRSTRVQSIPLASGDAGVEQTIRAMRRLIEQGKKDPIVHETAAMILRGANVPAFNWSGEVRAIYSWVLQNIRFTRDVYGKETLHSAPEILRLRIGDCDDFTILLCSLLGTIGHKTRIVTIAKPEDERNFSHVFPQVCLDGAWVTIDAARRNAAIGRNPENTERVRVWDTASDHFVDVQGLNGEAAGRSPNALPGAYPAWVADPRFRSLRGHTIRGVGHYGVGEVGSVLSGMRATSGDPVAQEQFRKQMAVQMPVATRNDDSRRQLMKKLRFIAPDGAAVEYAARSLGEMRIMNARAMKRGLGIDWGDITSAIEAGTTGAANIISATRASPYNLFPTTAAGGRSYAPPSAYPPAAGTAFGGISTGTLLLGGLGILAVAMIAGGRR
jgi:hypothetical protein